MDGVLLDRETEKLISRFGTAHCRYEQNSKPKAEESPDGFFSRKSKHLDEALSARENLRERIGQLVQDAKAEVKPDFDYTAFNDMVSSSS